ncbi:hypothetical protein OF83DRAFT_1167075 [Amylostereum chailletii]|nr:hypothetical protein OF83DRAFT_1167075 [Amylostereum chailletii]
MSAIQLPEEQLIELMLTLKKTTPDQARSILNSQPQIAYGLITLMVKMNAINVDVLQHTLTHQNGPPPAPALPAPSVLPPHLHQQPTRGNTPQSSTPPPTAYSQPPQHEVATSYDAYTNGPVLHTTPFHSVPQQVILSAPSPQISTLPETFGHLPEEQKTMILHILNMTPEQVASLPPTERATYMQLRAQVSGS